MNGGDGEKLVSDFIPNNGLLNPLRKDFFFSDIIHAMQRAYMHRGGIIEKKARIRLEFLLFVIYADVVFFTQTVGPPSYWACFVEAVLVDVK